MLIYRGVRVEEIAMAIRRDDFRAAYLRLCSAFDRIQADRLPLEDGIFIAADDVDGEAVAIAYLTAEHAPYTQYGDEGHALRRAVIRMYPPLTAAASGEPPTGPVDTLTDLPEVTLTSDEVGGELGYTTGVDLSDQQVEQLATRLGIPVPSYGVDPTVPYSTDDETQGIIDIELSLQLLAKALGLPVGYRLTHVDQNEVQQRLGSACLTVVGPVTSHCPRLTLNSAIMRLQIPSPRQRNIHGALDPELHRAILGDTMRAARTYDPGRGWRYADEPEAAPRERSVQI
jgi:hypothetical protein